MEKQPQWLAVNYPHLKEWDFSLNLLNEKIKKLLG